VCNYDFGKNGPFLVPDDFKGDMPPVASQLFAFDLRPDGTTLAGVAQAVDWDGRLVVATADGTVELASGDVQHVRRV